MRKLFLFLIIGIFITSCATKWKLPPKRLVEKDYRQQYGNIKNDVKKENQRLINDDWDIIIDPIEAVPVQSFTSAQNNWGELLLLPNDLRQRIAKECVNPVYIKIFDTAGSSDHNSLQKGRQPGTNYTTSETLNDIHGHGTHVAGIAVADDFGMLSELVSNGTVIWKFVKVLNDNGSGSFSWIANAIKSEDKENESFLNRGVAVIVNGSLGGGTNTINSVEKALENSTKSGVMYAFAAGNSGKDVKYPGKSKYTVACASLDRNMVKSIFSSVGPEVDFAYPGRAILSTWKDQRFVTLSGTSMATPFLTSVMAIAKSKWGDLIPSQSQMKYYLTKVATDIDPAGKDDMTGWGIAFVKAILDTKPGEGNDDPPLAKSEYQFTFFNKAMKWRTHSMTGYNYLIIPEITIRVQDIDDPIRSYNDWEAFTTDYFSNKGVVIADDKTPFYALYATGRFYELQAAKAEKTVQIKDIIGIDDNGRRWHSEVKEEDGEVDAKFVLIKSGFETPVE